METWISLFYKRSEAKNLFDNVYKLLSNFALADEVINEVELFDFDHPLHPQNCEINDEKDLAIEPHSKTINLFINSSTQGPSIEWKSWKLKENLVICVAAVYTIKSFYCELFFSYDDKVNEWKLLDKEHSKVKEVLNEFKMLNTLAK